MCVGGCGYSLTHGVSCKWEASRTLSTQDHLAHLQEWMCTVFGGDIDFMAEDLWLSMISSRSSWTSIDDTLGLTWVTILSPELTVHVGDSTQLGCVFQSTAEDKHMTKVDWMFSLGENAKVRRSNHHCVAEAPGCWCQDSVGRGRI